MVLIHIFGQKYSLSRESNHHDTDTDSEQNIPFIEAKTPHGPQSPKSISLVSHVWPWITTTICLTVTLIYLLLERQHYVAQCSKSKFPGFDTDLQDARDHIDYEEKVFTGKFGFDKDNKTVYREIKGTQYFGPPSQEIDDAWDDLLRGEFVRLTAAEAEPYTPEFTRFPDTGYYYFEPDMFHSLHCLDAIRKDLDADYYADKPSHMDMAMKNSTAFPDNWPRIHRDHCLDQLRQSIQCQGDLSPVLLHGWEGVPIGLGVGQTHTCRKWEPMRDWMDMRKKLHKQDLDW